MSNKQRLKIVFVDYAHGIDPQNWQIKGMVKATEERIKPGEKLYITKHHRGGWQYYVRPGHVSKGHKIVVTIQCEEQ